MSISTQLNIPALAADVGNNSTKFTLGRDRADQRILTRRVPSFAPRLSSGSLHQAAGTERTGIVVTLHGDHYYFGDDVLRVAKVPPVRQGGESFILSPVYEALVKGAIAEQARFHKAETLMTVSQYVVGVLVSLFVKCRERVEQITRGDHLVPGFRPGSSVQVRIEQATVIAQPQGALLTGLARGMIAPDEATVVLDLGGGTLDCLTCHGKTVNWDYSGAVNLGTLACAEAAADVLAIDASNPLTIDLIDSALRSKRRTVEIDGFDHSLDVAWRAVDVVLSTAFEQIRKFISASGAQIRRVVLTGGGAYLLERGVGAYMPQYQRYVVRDYDPVMGNVRGFHVLAELLGTDQRQRI